MSQALVQALVPGLFLLLPLLFLVLYNTKRAIKKSRLPPSPPKLPFIGNLHQLGSLPHRSLRVLSEKHGPLMLLHLGQVRTLVVSSPEMAQEIMRTHDLIFASRPASKVARILLHGSDDLAFAPYGEYWRQARKLCVTHLLSAKMVQLFRQVREEEVALMIAKITQSSSSLCLVNMSEVLNSFANDIICRVVSGKFFRKDGRTRNDVFREMVEENTLLFGAFHVADYFSMMAWVDVFFGLDARAKRNSERWDNVLDEVLKDHADRSKLNDETHKNTDFVNVLLSLQKDSNADFALKNEDIKALLIDMLGAGTETSYIVLEWSLAELVRNSEVMEKLQDEVKDVAGGKDMIREEDLSKMSYLKAVIKEVLRIHPPAPLLAPRESMEDCQVKGYEIPRKTRVIINAWAIGRDSKFWEAPDEFRPERFIGSSLDFKGGDFQFIPFGAGRRICPGMNFAVSTIELALANLIHRFNWELPDGMTRDDLDMDDAPGITTRKKQRLHLVAKLNTFGLLED